MLSHAMQTTMQTTLQAAVNMWSASRTVLAHSPIRRLKHDLLPGALHCSQKVRITEANSLSGAGEEGTSDSYAAALWTVDISFEFAAVSIQSLHFHFGHGGLPGNSVEAGVPVYSGECWCCCLLHFTSFPLIASCPFNHVGWHMRHCSVVSSEPADFLRLLYSNFERPRCRVELQSVLLEVAAMFCTAVTAHAHLNKP
jgi:hypothetical protein